nr:CGNR zinc finger domain-containing protein [uncultured Actinoplanes sp.]
MAQRSGLGAAPHGLVLVQSLINTSIIKRAGDPDADRLSGLPVARAWLGEALAAWATATGRPAPPITLGEHDLVPLRELRETLRTSLRAEAPNAPGEFPPIPAVRPEAAVRLTIEPGGVRYDPAGTGVQAVTGLVAVELLLAQATGAAGRLKTCASPTCGVAFYDASPNRARVWHDTKVCGFPANLRASRFRKAAGPENRR